MRLSAEYGGEAPLDLIRALLLYGSQDLIRLATLHTPEPDPNGGPPILSEGRPLTRAFVQQLSRDLQEELPVVWLPEHIIVWSQGLVAWWEPARLRPMFFSPESDGRCLDGRVFPHPPLLFALQHRRLSVWALPENRRPSPQSLLAVAPYWNTAENGGVCHGSMAVPSTVEVANLAQWSGAYFGSRFSHPNFARPLCRHPEGFLGLWRDLASQGHFPLDLLIPGQPLCVTLRLTV